MQELARKVEADFAGKLKAATDEVSSLQEQLEAEQAKGKSMQVEVDRIKAENVGLAGEVNSLRTEVENSVAEFAETIGAGCKGCHDRLVAIGVDFTSHSFADYCNDLSTSLLGGSADDQTAGN